MNIGILTAGGDSPGLNAAIRAIGKTAQRAYGMNVIGFREGFRGLMENRFLRLDDVSLSGILTKGGTILGTSRDKPHKMPVGGQTMDMTGAMIENYERHQLDALVCIGGGGTHKNAVRLADKGINVITLPKTIDNDVWGTDATMGFDTALGIATEAIDRLHSTAHSHHRIMVVEIMGHNTGWLALGSALAGGADVALIPEVPYTIDLVANTISARRAGGSPFSIVAISEGAVSVSEADELAKLKAAKSEAEGSERSAISAQIDAIWRTQSDCTHRVARELEMLTKLEARVTILGHVQRGGTPSAVDRVLATRLGAAATTAIAEGAKNVMVAVRDDKTVHVPIHDVAGRRKTVPLEHPWIRAARRLGMGLGD